MLLTPIDTLKTTQQTQGGVAGLTLLRERIREHGISCLFWGAFGTAGATFVGHCEWKWGAMGAGVLIASLVIARPVVRRESCDG